MATDNVIGKDQHVHPLSRKKISQIETWEEWKKHFKAARRMDEFLGLLHSGFSCDLRDDMEAQGERVCLYLEIADGYKNRKSFLKPGEEEYLDSSEGILMPHLEIRRKIVYKAQRMVVEHFFAADCKIGEIRLPGYPTLSELVLTECVLPKLLWFFDARRFDDDVQLSNLPYHWMDSRDQVELRRFLREFVELCWKFAGIRQVDYWVRSEERHDVLKKQLFKYRPQLIELMLVTKQLWLLVKCRQELDRASLAKLREISLRGKGPDGRSFNALEEAYADASGLSAMILLLEPVRKGVRSYKKAEKLQRQAKLKRHT